MSWSGSVNRFFVIDGIDGAGKSTQISLLTETLQREGYPVVKVRDPGGTELSDRIRAVLLSPSTPVSPMAELCLYAASRAQLVQEIIRPALEAGKVVVSDRFTWSTFAYQGYGRGIAAKAIEELEDVACGGIRPAHIFVLDLDPSKRLARLNQRLSEKGGNAPDRLELEGDAFFQRVRDGFLALSKQHPEFSTVLNATEPPEVLHAAIAAKVRGLLA